MADYTETGVMRRVSAERREIGLRVLSALVIAGVTAFASSWLTAREAQATQGTELAAIRLQIVAMQQDIRELRTVLLRRGER